MESRNEFSVSTILFLGALAASGGCQRTEEDPAHDQQGNYQYTGVPEIDRELSGDHGDFKQLCEASGPDDEANSEELKSIARAKNILLKDSKCDGVSIRWTCQNPAMLTAEERRGQAGIMHEEIVHRRQDQICRRIQHRIESTLTR